MLLTLAERRIRGGLIILCYHRVLPADAKTAYFLPDLVVTPESFRRQCLTLRRHYEVLPLHEAVDALCAGGRSQRPLAAVTFDDGYRDNARYAAPILAQTGIKATFFVVADLVGTDRPPWYDRIGKAVLTLARQGRARDLLAECGMVDGRGNLCPRDVAAGSARQVVADAKKLTPVQRGKLAERLCVEAGACDRFPPDDLIMDWSQLAELADCGHELGSHSAGHEILPQLDDASLEAEVAGSRRTLEKGLGRPVRSFCYPNGDVDERVVRAVAAAGYRCAVTVESGSNGPGHDAYRLKRRFIHEDRLAGPRGRTSAAVLRMELCNLADRVFGRWRDRADLP